MYDVIVVGGGHNGLVCACYLAREGKKVLVVEGLPLIGGMTTTEETVPEAPGFKMNPCAIDLILTSVPSSVIPELGLTKRYGLDLYDVDPYIGWLGPDGASIAFWRDLDRTAEEIGRFSKRDAEAYKRLTKLLINVWKVGGPYLQGHPTRPGAKVAAKTAWRAFGARKSVLPMSRVMLSSPMQVLDELFEHDLVKAAIASFAGVGMAPLEEPGSGAVFAMMSISHEWGCTRAVGGMGAFTESLVRCLTAHGGEVRVDAPVGEIIVRNGRATGIALQSGEEIFATDIVGALDPHTLFSKLTPHDALPAETHHELKHMQNLRHNITLFKGDAALTRRPDLSAFGDRANDLLRSAYMSIAPSVDYVRSAISGAMAGELVDEVPMWVAVPSVYDRSLVPPGSKGDSLYFYPIAAPYELANGQKWVDEKDKVLWRCLDVFDSYAPGVRDSVIGIHADSPTEVSAKAHKGNVLHLDATLTQLGPWRPTPSLAGFKSPVEGLWHAGAGAHPMPAVNGWSGRSAAQTLLKERDGFGAKLKRRG